MSDKKSLLRDIPTTEWDCHTWDASRIETKEILPESHLLIHQKHASKLPEIRAMSSLLCNSEASASVETKLADMETVQTKSATKNVQKRRA